MRVYAPGSQITIIAISKEILSIVDLLPFSTNNKLNRFLKKKKKSKGFSFIVCIFFASIETHLDLGNNFFFH